MPDKLRQPDPDEIAGTDEETEDVLEEEEDEEDLDDEELEDEEEKEVPR